MSYVFYALAKCAVQLKCYKPARICYEKLNQFKIPAEWSEEIDLQSLLVRSKPYTDDESKLPLCMRCQTYNAIINVNEQQSLCNACLHPLFFHSSVSNPCHLLNLRLIIHYLEKMYKDYLILKKYILIKHLDNNSKIRCDRKNKDLKYRNFQLITVKSMKLINNNKNHKINIQLQNQMKLQFNHNLQKKC